MGVDRESAVRKAEELVREGKIELAIEEYLRLVEEQPGDVGAANALGDLYAKVGNRALAVAQFVQIGDAHRESGFVPKAVAFYKKALKVDPASDHALSQLAQIAAGQALYADATLYLNRLLQRRREQNNEAGVAECLVRLGAFPSASADAKMAAARAAADHSTPDQTARLWMDAADALDRAGRPHEAVDVLIQAASLDPADETLRRRVVAACAATGQIERARAYLSFETAGDHPDLLLALAGQELAEGRHDEARRALERVIAVAPDHRAEAEAMLSPLQAAAAPPASGPEIPADVFAVDVENAGSGDVSSEPDLAAVFGSGGETEAAGTSSEPSVPPVGTARAVPETAAQAEPAPAGVDVDAEIDGGVELFPAEPPASAPEPPREVQEDQAAAVDVSLEVGPAIAPDPAIPGAVDLGSGAPIEGEEDALDASVGDIDERAVAPEETILESVEELPHASLDPDAPDDVEQAIMAEATVEEVAVEEAAVHEFAAEDAVVDAPAVAEAAASQADLESIAALTAAAENPALQFQASAQLGRLLFRLGRVREGIGWLERATQAVTSVRDQRLDVMYELADALERSGERVRALEVFADLDFDAASFRDVPERIAALRHALGEGRAT